MVVTVNEKKEFLRWFLSNVQMKKRECVWTLNYLLSHDYLMKKVHFVEDAKYCPRGMVMAANNVTDEPYQFFKGNIMTTDAEKGFHDVRLNRDEDVFIELKFKDWHKNSKYISVLEENPFIPKEENLLSHGERQWMERNLNDSLEKFKLNHLMDQIDFALETKNEALFMELSGRLVEYK